MPLDNFYEILGTQANASPEEIKRAYRKRALQTHPDRLPPGATVDDKKSSEEQFRKVNNAYEILIDPKNRKLYDLYGVWPPPDDLPEENGPRHAHRSGHRRPAQSPDPFDDFFNFPRTSPFGDAFARHHRPRHAPAFSHPFELFNIIFADMYPSSRSDPSQMFPRFSDPFWGHHSPMFNRGSDHLRPTLFPPPPMFRPFLAFPEFHDERPVGSPAPSGRSGFFSFEGESRDFYGRGSGSDEPQWVSEKRMIRTINGVTQSIWKRVDRNGNEHVTYTYPDGREQYTVNGREQYHPSQHIQGPSATPVDPQYAPPPPVIPPEQQTEAPSKKHWWKGRH